MKSADGSAGDSDEEKRPYGQVAGVYVGEEVRIGQDGISLGEQGDNEPQRHKDEQNTYNGVKPADDTIEGDDGSDEIVGENEYAPGQCRSGREKIGKKVGEETGQQCGRGKNKGCAYHDHKQNGEAFHEDTRPGTKVAAYDFGVADAVFTDGNHACDIIMYRAGENGTEDDPQQCDRPVQGPENGAEHRTEACDIDHLAHVEFPRRHGGEVHSVPFRHNGSGTGAVGSEHAFHKGSVQRITCQEQCTATKEV